MSSLLTLLLFTTLTLSSPLDSCPKIHVFGARETTAPQGYGTAATVVNLVTSSHSGSTAEAIVYPACGGQSSCGGVSYANSAAQGTSAVAQAVNSFNERCPDTELVLVGYSQGGQIMDNAVCGDDSGKIGLSTAALAMTKAVILMGDPRHIVGLPYNVGTCQASGVSPPFYPFSFSLWLAFEEGG